MLLRHSLAYLWARGLPSLISFAGLALFTRLLPPEQFGVYAIVMAAVLLGNAVIFGWLRLSVLRFLPSARNRAELLSTTIVAYLGLTLLVALGTAIALVLVPAGPARGLLVMGAVLVCLSAWLELSQAVPQADLNPAEYGRAAIAKAVIGVLAGASLAAIGWGAWGLLGGVALGTAVPSVFLGRTAWKGVAWHKVDRGAAREILRYGLPLTASLSLSFIVRGSDRLFLGWLAGASVAGIYAAGYDIAQNSLQALMTIINAAAFPLAVTALERDGEEAVRDQLSQNVTTLVAVALPAAVGLSFVARDLAAVLLGAAFRVSAARLIPWVACGVLLSGLRAYYVDHAFKLGRHTVRQVYVLAVAAGSNVVLNVLLIPSYGLMGAAYSTVASYAVALVAGIALSRSAFPLPFPVGELWRAVAATAGMALVLWVLSPVSGVLGLAVKVGAGFTSYLALMFLLNGMQLRGRLLSKGNSGGWA